MVTKIKREDISSKSQLKTVVAFLEQNIKDEIPRKPISDFNHGELVGELKILDMLRSLNK